MKCTINSKNHFLWILLISVSFLKAQTTQKNTYVIVHGAWGGAWAFKSLDSLLSMDGNIVYRPTLTGQGERVHLASKNIGLNTHIQDVANTILYEKLNQVILVGHSYGGMVITGVADKIPERISKIIYVDAMIPEHNESVYSIFGSDFRNYPIKNGYIIPPWVKKEQTPPKDVPHPLKTWTDKISLKNEKRNHIPAVYILTVEKNKNPETDDYATQAARARQKKWPVYILEATHNPQWSNLNGFHKMLQNIEK